MLRKICTSLCLIVALSRTLLLSHGWILLNFPFYTEFVSRVELYFYISLPKDKRRNENTMQHIMGYPFSVTISVNLHLMIAIWFILLKHSVIYLVIGNWFYRSNLGLFHIFHICGLRLCVAVC